MSQTPSIKQEIRIKGFHSIYYFAFSKDFYHDPEQHDSWEMVYVDNGKVNAMSNGVGCVLEQGQAIFHCPMESHAHVSDKRVANNMVVVSFTAEGKKMKEFKGKTFTLDKTAKTLLTLFLEEVKEALGKVPDDYNDRTPPNFQNAPFGASQLLQCYFTEFLIKLLRADNGVSVVPNKDARAISNNSVCTLIIEYMKRSVNKNLNLKDVCDLFFIGKTQLCKIFKEHVGKSPMDYFADLKTESAKKLLQEKKMSVSEISDALGYSSVHNFSRAFKKYAGYSPSAYRKKIL
ncbi:MAG: helix-turn-helix transcriptional regulator [Clostridia bacterium]|nr:helix-turn-helix transcriptional regulator [Clostridia bacterium]